MCLFFNTLLNGIKHKTKKALLIANIRNLYYTKFHKLLTFYWSNPMKLENSDEYTKNSVSAQCKETAMFIVSMIVLFAVGIALF